MIENLKFFRILIGHRRKFDCPVSDRSKYRYFFPMVSNPSIHDIWTNILITTLLSHYGCKFVFSFYSKEKDKPKKKKKNQCKMHHRSLCIETQICNGTISTCFCVTALKRKEKNSVSPRYLTLLSFIIGFSRCDPPTIILALNAA